MRVYIKYIPCTKVCSKSNVPWMFLNTENHVVCLLSCSFSSTLVVKIEDRLLKKHFPAKADIESPLHQAFTYHPMFECAKMSVFDCSVLVV
jgi:hypothetical protein